MCLNEIYIKLQLKSLFPQKIKCFIKIYVSLIKPYVSLDNPKTWNKTTLIKRVSIQKKYVFNPSTRIGVPEQTVLTQIRCHRTLHLIRVYTVSTNPAVFKHIIWWLKGLVQILGQIWVRILLSEYLG